MHRFIAHLFPRSCASCDAETTEPLLCPVCAVSLYPNPSPCPRCALPHRAEGCPCTPGELAAAHSPYLYGGELAVVLQRLKYQSRSDLARATGRFVAPSLAAFALEFAADLVVPVPSHWRTRLRRGMDHALEIARATRCPVPVAPALGKVRRTHRQAELRWRERQANVAGCFAARRRWRTTLVGARVVLFDDVATTMATLREGAAALRGAGCASVAAFTVARAEP